MYRYEPGPDMDLAVAGMWSRMRADGDLDTLFPKDSQGLASLYDLIRGPSRGLLFEADATEGIWLAMWFEQVMGVAFSGLWIARPRRATRPALRSLLITYEQALRWFPAILGVTKQEDLLRPHRRLGYQVLGQIPGIWDGGPAWLVMLTRSGFAAANCKRLARLRLETGETP